MLPKVIADQAKLGEGSVVDVTTGADGRVIIVLARQRPTLAELVAQCDPNTPYSDDERAWMEAPSVGLEKF